MRGILIGLVIAAGVLALWLWRRSQSDGGSRSPPRSGAEATSTPVRPLPVTKELRPPAAAPEVTRELRPPAPLPPALAAFRLVAAEQLEPDARASLAERLQVFPPPPRALRRLLGEGGEVIATPVQLEEMMLGEGTVAYKILAVINSPFHGLPQRVHGIAAAAPALPLCTLRSICLQHLINEAFPIADPAREQDRVAHAQSLAIACELACRLGVKLHLPDVDALVTPVALSFVGRMAAVRLLEKVDPGSSLLDRSLAEQQALGLSATEIGRLLLRQWGVAEEMVEQACAIDAPLWQPVELVSPSQVIVRAVGYLCARLGELLAAGHLQGLLGFDPADQQRADFHHLRSYLARSALARLPEYLHSADLEHAVQRMLKAIRE